ncbi:helix-turn-helix domain-containing protein [Vibrio sp. SCSIO 43136]|uniref:helix-turn-helix domain-containing protein n=1 Tax=Vibrio sp. SCSIO 43136 TaxID=2819101 RepID=UPI002075550E|nr:helix-turn-helix domain-containing protein [Vibrio sp. SCSIO 43136]USD65612.1 XRE family transcriptional regulator [Vibrio sp. SCSIO 43136]
MAKQSKPLSELLAKEKPEVLEQARLKADEMLLDLRLAEIRTLTNQSQVQIAQAMGVTQPTIASLEKKGKDVRLMSLKRYVEAAGCKLRIDIEMPDGSSHELPI